MTLYSENTARTEIIMMSNFLYINISHSLTFLTLNSYISVFGYPEMFSSLMVL